MWGAGPCCQTTWARGPLKEQVGACLQESQCPGPGGGVGGFMWARRGVQCCGSGPRVLLHLNPSLVRSQQHHPFCIC